MRCLVGCMLFCSPWSDDWQQQQRMAQSQVVIQFCAVPRGNALTPLLLQGGLTPAAVVERLDRVIIGQEDAKKAVAIAFRNRCVCLCVCARVCRLRQPRRPDG